MCIIHHALIHTCTVYTFGTCIHDVYTYMCMYIYCKVHGHTLNDSIQHAALDYGTCSSPQLARAGWASMQTLIRHGARWRCHAIPRRCGVQGVILTRKLGTHLLVLWLSRFFQLHIHVQRNRDRERERQRQRDRERERQRQRGKERERMEWDWEVKRPFTEEW